MTAVPRACKVCGALGTPDCVRCPTAFSRWQRASCRFAWRWRASVSWSAATGAAAVLVWVTGLRL